MTDCLCHVNNKNKKILGHALTTKKWRILATFLRFALPADRLIADQFLSADGECYHGRIGNQFWRV